MLTSASDEFAGRLLSTRHGIRTGERPVAVLRGPWVETFELPPEAQLAVLPRTTHVGLTRRPGELLALITPFLDSR
jgi:hypothetical protein